MNDYLLDQIDGPHQGARVHVIGNTVNPTVALILMHGRGTSAEHMVNVLGTGLPPPHVVVLVPEAKNQVWFPGRFFDPKSQNEPHLTSALTVISVIVSEIERRYGIGKTNIVLAGFSQGASLVSEYLVHHTAQFRGACIFSGGLCGTVNEIDGVKNDGFFLQTPVYMGCDIADPHVPLERFKKTRDVLTSKGAKLTYSEYDGLRHAIHPEGLQFLAQLIRI